MSAETTSFDPAITVFMLVKTTPEWLRLSAPQRADLLAETIEPLLRKHREDVRLRLYDIEFYATRVTDLWLWEARTHRAYQRLVEDLRDTPFWDRYFAIVEILPSVETAYLRDDGRVASRL
ncbi:MAG: darcynin family protein [Acetobacteraceae bacterium]